jgi:hypothetical protein
MTSLGINLPAAIVCAISVVVGLLTVVVFGYVSDQHAVRIAKDRLKAHLLALRLFQDQIPVVLRAYVRILLATGRYLRLALKPLLVVIIPLTFLIAEVDRFLGMMPLQAGHDFLIKAHADNNASLDGLNLQLPDGLASTAPAVHVPSQGEVVWRVIGESAGRYRLKIKTSGQADLDKSVVIGSGIPRLSPVRFKGQFWKRIFLSAEPSLPESGGVQSIEVMYPQRQINFVGLAWNWIWLFLVVSLAAGFLFKSILGIEI